ncbi:T9SS type A sorting domain-containing protein [Flavivirga jejuensis]|uniref:T9SS type A sorting domain-containing protein n=1 Tax=Flavivirga jejuensis TaxID=870487 RepID=A0ABT8WJ54_9FLAO|nr:T9SS type A sorting domain-containing protein [Flavivirga jejuensis]MDO5973001.1 T9SS type A sorting domain-containing protein [Flavivirga jejuensis]
MKQIYLLTAILFLSCSNLIAQTIDVATKLNLPQGMVLNGNDLYFAQHSSSTIYKIDITESTPITPTPIVTTGLSSPTGLALNGNDLYISQAGGTISKIDISQTPPITPTSVISGLTTLSGIILNGNELYIAELTKISKIDITETTPTPTEVVRTLLLPIGMAINGNDLYFTQNGSSSNKISKIDITTNPLPAIPIPVVSHTGSGLSSAYGLELNGNILYIADYFGQKISKIDITETLPIIPTTVVTTGLVDTEPYGIVLNGNDLYMSQPISSKISKFNLSPPLSINSHSAKNSIKSFPNPSKGLIQISGLSKTENYIIYNIIGNKINEGTISNNEKIDIQNLTNGVYFLKIKNEHTIKFIKE